MKKRRRFFIITYLLFGSFSSLLFSQRALNFEEERARENYDYLKDSTTLAWPEAVKYIPLTANRNSYFSIGGSFRPRYEHFTNRSWVRENNEDYYSQRLSFHSDWHLGKHIRLFGEFYHGYKTQGATFLQTDDIDLHQGFLEVRVPLQDTKLILRAGRQEMKLGAGRLVDLRVGPNLRRSFDLIKVGWQSSKLHLKAFYGNEVQIGTEAFDNASDLFSTSTGSPKLWGAISEFAIFPQQDFVKNTNIYYIGYQDDVATFSDVTGMETRHSIGLRRFGRIGKKFQYNSELIYQFGDLAGSTISAINFETDWKYTFIRLKWRPTIGLKFDWSSGDRGRADGKMNSFNPLFVNPSIYSLAAVNTPVNLLSIHPSLLLFPGPKWFINLEFATFFRSSTDDGLYAPPGIQIRSVEDVSERHIGNTIGVFIKYTHSSFLSIDLRSSYFISGNFVEATGPAENIFQFTPTLTLQF